VRKLLEAPLDDLEQKLFQRTIGEVDALFTEAVDEALAGVSRHFRGGVRLAVEEIERLLVLTRRAMEERSRVEGRHQALGDGVAASRTEDERRELMLGFLSLFTPQRRLHGDRKAFDRYMGQDCVEERYHRWRSARMLREEVLVRAVGRRVAEVIRAVMKQDEEPVDDLTRRVHRLVTDLEIEGVLLRQAQPGLRWRNRCGALRALGEIARALPADGRSRLLQTSVPFVVRCALDQRQPVWVQREALRVLPALVQSAEAERVLVRRLFDMDPGVGDDLFVRAEAVRVLASVVPGPSRLTHLLERVLSRPDPSELVRMEAALLLGSVDRVEADRTLLEKSIGTTHERDASARVRVRCLEALRLRAERLESREEVAAGALARAILFDPDELVRRASIEEAVLLALHRRARLHKFKVDDVDRVLLVALDRVIRDDPAVKLKRLAEEAREAIVVRNQQSYAWFEGRLLPQLDALDEHGSLSVRQRDIAVPDEVLGRLLAQHARDGFGFTVERRRRRYVIRKGDRFRMRLWRVLHEMRNPDTAKRQAHRHTTGRTIRGALRSPPGAVAELVETKVPGERVWFGEEVGWRRFLPLVDDYLSTFSWLPWRRQRRVRIYASEGVTEIRDDRSWWRALRSHLRMSWQYAALARTRCAHPDHPSETDRGAYLRTMRDIHGFETAFYPAAYTFDGVRHVLDDPTLRAHFADASRAESHAPDSESALMAKGAGLPPLDRTATAPARDLHADDATAPGIAPRRAEDKDRDHGPTAPAHEEAASGLFWIEDLLQPLVSRVEREAAAPLGGEGDAPCHDPEDTDGFAEYAESDLDADVALRAVGTRSNFDPEETQAVRSDAVRAEDSAAKAPGDETAELRAADETAPLGEAVPAGVVTTGAAAVPPGTASGLAKARETKKPHDETTADHDAIAAGMETDASNPSASDTLSPPTLEDTADAPELEDTADTPALEDTADAPELEDTGDAPELEDTADAPGLEDTADAPGLADTADTPGLDDTADVPAADDTADLGPPRDTPGTPELWDTHDGIVPRTGSEGAR
jgi:hypothetical protein